jgi:hypothetical protein
MGGISRADVARLLDLTRAGVIQLLDLALLAPAIQEQVLFAEAVDGLEPMSERHLRVVVRSDAWADQRAWCPRSAPGDFCAGRMANRPKLGETS